MESCTDCGRTLKERYKFCPRCGTAINHAAEPPATASRPRSTTPRPTAAIDHAAEPPVAVQDDSVVHPDIPSGFDRQTMFSAGILVLTHEKLMLYGRNGRDEIRNIPIELIQSCSVRKLIKKALIVKWRVNIEENFQKYWTELQMMPDQLMNKAHHYRHLAERRSREHARTEKAANRIASDTQKMLNRAQSMENKAHQAAAEVERLQADTEYAWQVKLAKADIRKDVLTLPSERASKHSPADEYKIWSYMIRRRMAGPASMQITSSPPEAVVVVDDVVIGATPLTIEKPLTEAAAINGKYHIKILLEDHRPKSLHISSAPKKSLWSVGPIEKAMRIASGSDKSESVNVRLVPRKRPNSAANQTVGMYREKVPDSTINTDWSNLELETPGTESILALVRDRVLVISSDKKRLLMEIPYSQITGAKVEKKFLRGIQGITISYQSGGTTKLEYGFELDTGGSPDSVSLMQHHCETIVERLQAHVRSAAEKAQQNAWQPAVGGVGGAGGVGGVGGAQDDSLDTNSLIVREKSDIKWGDVVGLEDAKKALYASIIYPAQRPDLFPMGWPKGMLLYGPPGTGKTMLAAATVNKMDGHFFNLPASTITSKWVGESEENVAKVFKTAREHAKKKPVVLFIDEADSLLGGGDESGHKTGYSYAKNQFLTEMDGVHTKGEQLLLFVMGATNKPWALDTAFLRRFQRRIYVPLPSIEARELLFRQYSKDLRTDGSVDIQALAQDSEGYSASDIRDICQTVHLETLHDLFETPGQGVAGNSNPRAVTAKDFQNMLSRRKPSVSSDMHEKYREWSLKHGTGNAAKQNEDEPVGAGDFLVREKPKVKWDDVVGLEDAKKALYASVIYPAQRPDLFPMGWPKGMLLYGPPGTGKTMLAAATVNKMDGHFFNLPASTITSKWVGESEENVAKVFKTAREHAKKKPVVLFIDEADSLLGGGDESGHKTGYSYAKNQFLTEMDGVHTKGDQLLLFVMGATNKPWALDMAFLRRFQKRVYIPLPSIDARELLFRQYTNNLSLDSSVVMRDLARISRGYSGSDIRDVCQGVHLETVHDLFEASGKKDSPDDDRQDLRIITKKDFQNMLSRRKPSVSSDMHDMYQKWSDTYGAG